MGVKHEPFLAHTQGLAIVLLLLSGARAETASEDAKTVMIPLDQIRLGSPGSRKLRNLEPEFFVMSLATGKNCSVLYAEGLKEIEEVRERAAFSRNLRLRDRASDEFNAKGVAKAGPGFAVKGRDPRGAARCARRVGSKAHKRKERFPSASEVSVASFTLSTQPGIRC